MDVMEEKELTLDQVVELLQQTIQNGNARLEVNKVKALFYNAKDQAFQAAKAAWVADGNKEEEFTIDFPQEQTFKALLEESKQKRAKEIQQLEADQERAFQIKQDIIQQLGTLVKQAETEGVDKIFNKVQELQQNWKNAGQVAKSKYGPLISDYQKLVQDFYDLVSTNKELREYDFKKNLEAKTALCEQAEELDKEPRLNIAFQRLQQLHDDWREIGPVAKEVREELWARFKAASDVVNKKHAAYYQQKKEGEVANLEAKTKLCEALEAIDYSKANSYKAWEAVTKQVLEIQEQWKKIGFAPKSSNTAIYERSRKACDTIFAAKKAFTDQMKATLAENLAKKRELCAKAEELKTSTDWKKTSDILVQLQKEWKTIGAIPHKYSDAIWKQFVGACDFFFDAKNKANVNANQEEIDNLEKKKAIVEEIKAFAGDTVDALKEKIASFNGIGHVPFKQKDNIAKEFKKTVNAQFDRLKVDELDRKLSLLASNVDKGAANSKQTLRYERDRLVRAYENMKNEILTRETNITFLTSKGGKPSPLEEQMKENITKLKNELAELREKIVKIEDRMNHVDEQ